MESQNLSFNDKGKSVNITINHYHNNEVSQNSNPINTIFNSIMMMGIASNLMGLSEPENKVEQISDSTKRTVIGSTIKQNLLSFNKEEAEDVEYSVSDEEKPAIETCKFKKLILSPIDNIPIINIEFDEENNSFTKLKENPEKYKSSISYRLSLLNIKTNIFMINLIDIEDKNEYKIIFTDNNQCESILNRYTKDKSNKDFISFNENVFDKLNFKFKDTILDLNTKVYIFELNSSFVLTKYTKNNEIKIRLEKL